MDFNISDVLKKKLQNNSEYIKQKEIYEIINLYTEIPLSYINFTRGIISFKGVSPLKKIHIKKNKKKIIEHLKDKDIIVRDII